MNNRSKIIAVIHATIGYGSLVGMSHLCSKYLFDYKYSPYLIAQTTTLCALVFRQFMNLKDNNYGENHIRFYRDRCLDERVSSLQKITSGWCVVLGCWTIAQFIRNTLDDYYFIPKTFIIMLLFAFSVVCQITYVTFIYEKNDIFIQLCKINQIDKMYKVKILYYLINPDDTIIIKALTEAVKIGNLEVTKWLYSICPNEPITKIFSDACEHKRLNIMEWSIELISNRRDVGTNNLFRTVCEQADLATAQWLYDKFDNFEISNTTMIRLCNNNKVEFVKWVCQMFPQHTAIISSNNAFVKYEYVDIPNAVEGKSNDQIIKILKLKTQIVDKTLDDCYICYDQSNVEFACGHVMCLNCMVECYVKKNVQITCGICRKNVKYHQIVYCKKALTNVIDNTNKDNNKDNNKLKKTNDCVIS